MKLEYLSKDQVIAFFQSHTDFFNVFEICEFLIPRGNVQSQEIAHIKDILHELKSGDFLLVQNEGRDIYNERFSSTPDRIKRFLKNTPVALNSSKKKERRIFYSWQSDLPNTTNRSFVEDTLARVAKSISADETVEVEPVIDRDTKGVAGSPDIASTIFSKIDEADVVVLDVSIINNPTKKRRMPNPNVMVELGYALKSKGYEKVILVFNKAYGEITDLPFDLRMRRLVDYRLIVGAKDRKVIRGALENELNTAIRAALSVPATKNQVTKERPLVALNGNLGVDRGPDGNHILISAKNYGKEPALDVNYYLSSDDGSKSDKAIISNAISPNESKDGRPYRYNDTDFFKKKLLNPRIIFSYKGPNGESYTSGNYLTQDDRADGFYNIHSTPGQFFNNA